MRMGDVLVMAGTAVVTVVFSLVLTMPRSVDAVDDAGRIAPRIAQPTFTTQGCEFRLKSDRPDYAAGQRPGFEIEAHNPTSAPVEATVWINVTATEPTSPISRVMPIPRTIWSHKCLVRLEPDQTQTVTVPCDAVLVGGQQIMVVLSDQAAQLPVGQLQVRQRSQLPPIPFSQRNVAGAGQ